LVMFWDSLSLAMRSCLFICHAFSGNHDQMEKQSHSNVAQMSNERGFTDSDVRGYFSTNPDSTMPDVEKSIEQSRENGGV
jgi:hypothetical protein